MSIKLGSSHELEGNSLGDTSVSPGDQLVAQKDIQKEEPLVTEILVPEAGPGESRGTIGERISVVYLAGRNPL